VVVCGHYGCGGVRAVMDGTEHLENSPSLRSWLKIAQPGVEATREGAGDAEAWWRRAVEQNVIEQLANVITYPPVIEALAKGALVLHGWVYDLRSLELRVYDAREGAFALAAEVLG
jgi:carbonic anhydrase